MSFEIMTEDQPGCDTPKRVTAHTLKKTLGWSIDAIALKEKMAPWVVEDILKGPLRRPDNPKYPSINVSKDPYVAQCEVEVPYPPKSPIKCLYSARYVGDLELTKASMVFTHGAGGTLETDAIVNFTHGFVSMSTRPTLLCFQGNMNLASRVKMFDTVIEQQFKASTACLGGRSMGARAAVMAATEQIIHLVLVSYPLQTEKEIRDQILLELAASRKVIFVSGDNDEMCDLEKLQTVRQQMKCKTWMIVVQGADHGMNAKPKPATQELGRMTGALVANWLDESDESLTEGTISWDADKLVAQWSGWCEPNKLPRALQGHSTTSTITNETSPGKSLKKPLTSNNRKVHRDEHDTEASEAQKSKKRRKIDRNL